MVLPALLGGFPASHLGEGPLYQGEIEGTILFTNVPSRADLIPRFRTGMSGSSRPLGGGRYRSLIREAAVETGLSEDLLLAVIAVESGFRPAVVSSKGAIGLMQLMPATARELGVTDPYDPRQNIFGGARYLRSLLDRFNGNLTFALAAYNAGEQAIRARQAVPPFPETRQYVRRVLERFDPSPSRTDPVLEFAPPPPPNHPMYYYVDEDGTQHFTDVPGEGSRTRR